jgi:hypothetical protein
VRGGGALCPPTGERPGLGLVGGLGRVGQQWKAAPGAESGCNERSIGGRGGRDAGPAGSRRGPAGR